MFYVLRETIYKFFLTKKKRRWLISRELYCLTSSAQLIGVIFCSKFHNWLRHLILKILIAIISGFSIKFLDEGRGVSPKVVKEFAKVARSARNFWYIPRYAQPRT